MVVVRKGNKTFVLSDSNQAAAFVNSGWEIVLPTVEAGKEIAKIEEVVEKEIEEVVEKDDGLDDMSLSQLRKLAKEKGINSFQMSAAKLREELRND